MKAEEIRALSDVDLEKRLQEARQELFNLRLRAATRQLENTAALRRVRRDVARLLTLKRERGAA